MFEADELERDRRVADINGEESKAISSEEPQGDEIDAEDDEAQEERSC